MSYTLLCSSHATHATVAAATAVYYIINADVIKLGHQALPLASTKSMTLGCCLPAVWPTVG